MQKFTQCTSKVIPLPLKDVDTDMIIPAQFLTRISSSGYGECLFRRLRDTDPDFPLNQEKYAGNQILVARDNFGCGSSREHAVWALLEYGIRVVISSSFADIFKNNSGKNGLVLIELPESIVDDILAKSIDGTYELQIDLEAQRIVLPDGTSHHFDYDPFRKECIVNGFNETDYLLSHKKEIEAFQSEREKQLFYSTLETNR